MPPYNQLHRINERYTWADYQTYKSHLMLPKVYLKIIFKNYRNSLSEVPVVLPQLLSKFNIHKWERMKIDASLQEKMYYIAGIPPVYIGNNVVPSCVPDVLRSYTTIKNQIDKFCGKGRILYLTSTYQENAMLAAANICKSAVDKKVKTFCISFVELLDEIKTFERTDKIKKLEESELLCVYFVGTEYQTPYTDTQLETILQRRMLEKKTTILVSHLQEKDYKKRYQSEIRGTILTFRDAKLTESLSDILKELEG